MNVGAVVCLTLIAVELLVQLAAIFSMPRDRSNNPPNHRRSFLDHKVEIVRDARKRF